MIAYNHVQLLVRVLLDQVRLLAVDALHLTEAVGRVTDARRKDFLAQHGIDDGTLAVRRASKEGDLHVISRQHLPNAGHLVHVALELLRLGLVNDLRFILVACAEPKTSLCTTAKSIRTTTHRR